MTQETQQLLNLCNALNNRTDHRLKFSVINGNSVLMIYNGIFKITRQEFYGGLDKIERGIRKFLLEF